MALLLLWPDHLLTWCSTVSIYCSKGRCFSSYTGWYSVCMVQLGQPPLLTCFKCSSITNTCRKKRPDTVTSMPPILFYNQFGNTSTWNILPLSIRDIGMVVILILGIFQYRYFQACVISGWWSYWYWWRWCSLSKKAVWHIIINKKEQWLKEPSDEDEDKISCELSACRGFNWKYPSWETDEKFNMHRGATGPMWNYIKTQVVKYSICILS